MIITHEKLGSREAHFKQVQLSSISFQLIYCEY
jgi:hypothetical protein